MGGDHEPEHADAPAERAADTGPVSGPVAAPVPAASLRALAAAGGRGAAPALRRLALRAQSHGGNRALARRLKLSGSAVADFKRLVEPIAGVSISGTDPAVVAPVDAGAPQSNTLKTILLTASNDATNDAKVEVGRGLAGVMVGKFGDVQQIDMDDVEALEKGSPGTGISKIAHEIAENYEHRLHPSGGFSHAHREGGIASENAVLGEMGTGGTRHSERLHTRADGSQAYAQDFGSYVLHMETHRVGPDPDANKQDVVYDKVQRVAPKDLEQLFQGVVTGYAANSDAVPAEAQATLAAGVAVLKKHPRSFIRIEGYRDEAESADAGRKRAHTLAVHMSPRPDVTDMFTYAVYDMPPVTDGGDAARKVVIWVYQVRGVRE